MSNGIKKRKGANEKLYELRKDIRDEFKVQINSFKSDIKSQYELNRKSLEEQNKKYIKIAIIVLAILGLTTVGGVIGAYKQVRKNVAIRLDKEFETERIKSLIEQTAKKYTEGEVQKYISNRVDKAINPVKNSLDKKLNEYSRTLEYINNLVEIYELESSARNGSRSAFEELQDIALKKDRIGASALNRIVAIKNIYSILQWPLGIMIGDLYLTKDEKKIPFKELSVAEMVVVLDDKRAALDQVHKMMTYLRRLGKEEVAAPLLNLLENSDNLAASVAACSILSHLYGPKAGIFEFNRWIEYLKQ